MITYLATNSLFIVICSVASFLGFMLTIIVILKTHDIDKQLTTLRVKQEYNETKGIYVHKLNTATTSLLDDHITQPSFFKNLLKNVSECKTKYHDLLSFSDKILIYKLQKELEKPSTQIDINRLTNYIAKLVARLSKNEEEKP